MSFSSKMRVAVLRGGPSGEYDVSLKTGEHILSTLRERPETYHPIDIFISKDGEWHREGLVHEPHHALKHVDVVWNALHGEYGEDGQVQKFLESLKIPFTGSGAVASAISMNKDMAKKIYRDHALNTPPYDVLGRDEEDEKLVTIFQSYLFPVIVKPSNGGSSLGVRLARSFAELKDAVKKVLKNSEKAIVEEFIRGREATCGVVDGFRDEKHYALVPIEIKLSKDKNFFDYDAKYSGKTKEICPGDFTPAERTTIEEMSKEAHRALGLRHYSRSDFIVSPKGRVYILETNSLPGMTAESLLPKSLLTIGVSSHDFIDHIIKLAV